MAGGKTSADKKEMIVKRIAGAYRRSRSRLALHEQRRMVAENEDLYESDRRLVDMINCVLQECGEDTRKVIEKEYLLLDVSDWKKEWGTKEEQQKARQSAIEEFMRCLNM